MPWLEEALILFEGNTEIRRYEPGVAEGSGVRTRQTLERRGHGVVHHTLVGQHHFRPRWTTSGKERRAVTCVG